VPVNLLLSVHPEHSHVFAECPTYIGWTRDANARQQTIKTAPLWRTVQGKRSAGGKKKCYKDSLKVSVKSFGIYNNTWESLAKNRSAWHAGITNGARDAEDRRT